MSIFIRTFACMKKNTSHTNLVTTIKALLHVVSLLSAPLLLTAAILMAACSGDDANDTNDTPTPTNDKTEIAFNTATTTWHDATRATTYNNAADLQTEGNFTCFAYDAGTTTVNVTSNVNGITATWNSSTWAFAEKHYWPLTGSLDFFAYMPATRPSYISADPASTYAVYDDDSDDSTPDKPNPSFTCSGLSASADKEFIYAVIENQNKDTNSGAVSLTFRHPFARIKLVEGTIGTGVTVNEIRLTGINNSGSYTHSTGWSGQSGDATYTVAAFGDTYYLVVPQNWAGDIEVDISWDNWGETADATLTTTVPTNWEAGHSYTYTFNVSKYALTVNIAKFTEQW